LKLNAATQTFLGIGGAIAMGYAGVSWIQNRAQEYHDNAMTPVVETLTNVDQGITIDRILSLLDARCDLLDQGRDIAHLELPLEQQLSRYQALTEREFPVGRCENGQRVR
jgi:hypothetical protein